MSEPNFPRTMSWSAYNLGTTGYNQAVAIGKALKDNYDVNLRVLPGKNDVSRLLPCSAVVCNFPPMVLRPTLLRKASFNSLAKPGGQCPCVSLWLLTERAIRPWVWLLT